LEVTQRLGNSAVFLSAGGYHHHIALNTWESLGGSPPPPGATGLYHTAIVYPSRTALADAFTGYCRRIFPWKERPTMALANPFICAIRTTTGLSCIGTSQKTSGRVRRMASWLCSPARST